MSVTKSLGAAFVVALAAAPLGCASQSTAFRHMSAADHEAAARATTDSTLAEEHADAAKRLRDDERSACYGVTDADRDIGPFGRADSVTGVEVVRDRGVFPKGPLEPRRCLRLPASRFGHDAAMAGAHRRLPPRARRRRRPASASVPAHGAERRGHRLLDPGRLPGHDHLAGSRHRSRCRRAGSSARKRFAGDDRVVLKRSWLRTAFRRGGWRLTFR